MIKDKNYFLDRISLAKKIKASLEDDIRSLDNEYYSSQKLMENIIEEISEAEAELKKIDKEIVLELMKKEKETSTNAQLKYIYRTKQDNIEDLKYEYRSVLNGPNVGQKTTVEQQEVGKIVQMVPTPLDNEYNKILAHIRQNKRQITVELEELRRKLKELKR